MAEVVEQAARPDGRGVRGSAPSLGDRPFPRAFHRRRRRRRVVNRRDFLKDSAVLLAALVAALYSGRVEAADPQPVTVLVFFFNDTANTEKMAQGVAEGAKTVSGTTVVLKRVGEVAANDLSSSDAVIVGSPVYFANMSGEVKTFFDNWSLKFDLFQNRKMRNKVGAAFSTGAGVSAGKE